MDRSIKVGDEVSIYANQADRSAVVLSIVGNDALLEYVMPAGRTFLRLVKLTEAGTMPIDALAYRTVSYPAVPSRFIDDMRKNGVSWLGGFDPGELSERMRRRVSRYVIELAQAQRARLA